MPRTTLDLDASVLRELKRRQLREKKTLGRLASELLARALADERGDEPPARFTWAAQDLQPLVDIEDNEAVWATLDRETVRGSSDEE